MKALFYKDFVSAKSTYLLSLAIMVVIAGSAVYRDKIILIPFMFVIMPMILNAISFGNEVQSNFPKFAFTTPISRKTYVKSKYGFAIIFGIVAFAFSLIIFYLEHENLDFALIMGVISFAIPIIFSAVQMPFILKFGLEKGRIIMVATYALLFITMSLLGEYLDGIMGLVQKISQLNSYIVSGFIFAIAVLILVISKNIGVAIIKAKEY